MLYVIGKDKYKYMCSAMIRIIKKLNIQKKSFLSKIKRCSINLFINKKNVVFFFFVC